MRSHVETPLQTRESLMLEAISISRLCSFSSCAFAQVLYPKQSFFDTEAKKAHRLKLEELHESQHLPQPKEKVRANISERELKVLKRMYREGVKLCHPDAMPQHLKAEAEKVFQDLQAAYMERNVAMVTLILTSLRNGRLQGSKIAHLKEQLQTQIEALKARARQLLTNTLKIKNSGTYKFATETSWEEFVPVHTAHLNQQILGLREEIRILKTGSFEIHLD